MIGEGEGWHACLTRNRHEWFIVRPGRAQDYNRDRRRALTRLDFRPQPGRPIPFLIAERGILHLQPILAGEFAELLRFPPSFSPEASPTRLLTNLFQVPGLRAYGFQFLLLGAGRGLSRNRTIRVQRCLLTYGEGSRAIPLASSRG